MCIDTRRSWQQSDQHCYIRRVPRCLYNISSQLISEFPEQELQSKEIQDITLYEYVHIKINIAVLREC